MGYPVVGQKDYRHPKVPCLKRLKKRLKIEVRIQEIEKNKPRTAFIFLKSNMKTRREHH